MEKQLLSSLLLLLAAFQPTLVPAQARGDISPYAAIKSDQPDVIENFLARGGDPNAIVPNGSISGGDASLLRVAYASRREDIFLALLDAGARMDIARLDSYQVSRVGMDKALDYLLAEHESIAASEIESALRVAIALGHYDSVEVVLRHIKERNLPLAELSQGAVGSAIGDDDIARLLIENGAPVSNAALRAAASSSSPGMMRYLLQLGADPFEPYLKPSGPRRDIYTAIDFAWDTYLLGTESQKRAATFKLFDLLALGATSTRVDRSVAVDGSDMLARIASPSERLATAAEWGFYDTVAEILAGPTPIESAVLTAATTAALRAQWDDIARLLLEAGAPPRGGPLHVAARKSSAGMVRLLIELGADPNEIVDGYTPVDYWFRDDPAVKPEVNVTDANLLRELIVGGAEVCGLVEQHRDELLEEQPSSYAVLWNLAPKCWPEQQ